MSPLDLIDRIAGADLSRTQAEELLRRVLAAADECGWRMVPLETTAAMWDACRSSLCFGSGICDLQKNVGVARFVAAPAGEIAAS